VLHAIWNIKTRLLRHGGVANPRDTYGYRCGLRLALTQNPSFLFVPSSMQHYTGGLSIVRHFSPKAYGALIKQLTK